MSPSLTAELSGTLRGFLARRAEPILPVAAPGGCADPLWPRLCAELGVGGLLVPAELDGLGLGPPEVAAVAAELGRVLDGGPFVPSAVSATAALAALPVRGDVAAILGGLSSGSVTACLAHDPFGAPGDRPVADAGDAVTGRVPPFLAGGHPDVLVVPVLQGGVPALAVVAAADPGVDLEFPAGLDLTRPAARARFSGAGATVVARGPDAARAVAAAEVATMIAVGAECVGVAAHALDLTVGYLGGRRQFGRVVGSFQAVKHQLADLAVTLEVARSAVDLAVRSDPDPRRARATAHALMATAGAAAVTVTTEAIQLHGGIGYTWEHPAHHLLRRAHTDAALLGTPAQHHRALYALLEAPSDVEGPP